MNLGAGIRLNHFLIFSDCLHCQCCLSDDIHSELDGDNCLGNVGVVVVVVAVVDAGGVGGVAGDNSGIAGVGVGVDAVGCDRHDFWSLGYWVLNGTVRDIDCSQSGGVREQLR